MLDLQITQIGATGFAQLWPIFKAVIADGDTYSYPPDLDQATACAMWTSAPARCFVARRVDESGKDVVVGGYTLRPNQPGLGNHVANAGYMVAPNARGQGIASRLCEHSLEQARHTGFTAMQFNFVVSSNAAAVRLWQRHGFVIVGQIPGAFRHVTLGPTDVYVMHRHL
jgi:ribosomal protein S18 acetylase RimI-like enzyme